MGGLKTKRQNPASIVLRVATRRICKAMCDSCLQIRRPRQDEPTAVSVDDESATGIPLEPIGAKG